MFKSNINDDEGTVPCIHVGVDKKTGEILAGDQRIDLSDPETMEELRRAMRQLGYEIERTK